MVAVHAGCLDEERQSVYLYVGKCCNESYDCRLTDGNTAARLHVSRTHLNIHSEEADVQSIAFLEHNDRFIAVGKGVWVVWASLLVLEVGRKLRLRVVCHILHTHTPHRHRRENALKRITGRRILVPRWISR